MAREQIPADPTALKARLKQVIVDALMLDVATDDIEDTAPLFGGGLGLDSVDALELAVEFERVFGVRIPDDEASRRVFASVESLAAFFATQAHA